MAEDLQFAQQFIRHLPFSNALNMRVENIGPGRVTLSMPYDPRLVGDPETGVLHGGAVSALIDTCGGAAVMLHPTGSRTTATLDLRIDYMRSATPQHRITATAECHHVTRAVAFVRIEACDQDTHSPVATAHGAFMVEHSGGQT